MIHDIIHLQPFTKRDIEKLIDWLPNEKAMLVWGGLSFHYPLTQDQLIRHIQLAESISGSHYLFKGVLSDNNEIVGHCELTSVNRLHGLGRISRVLIGDPDRRGQGLGQAMLHQLLDFAFHELNLHRIDLGVFDFNQRAIACYEKLGFQLEGVMREARRYQNEHWNICVMSLLKHEWKGEGS